MTAAALAPEALLDELRGRRWFAADDEAVGARVAQVVHADEALELVLVDVAFRASRDRTYVLALAAGGGDALADLPALRRLTELAGVTTPCASVRAAAAEQTNSAVVIDESVVLKLYRRVDDGPGVEAELLGALASVGFRSAPALCGVLDHGSGDARTTLALVTRYVPSVGDGWELTLASLRRGDPTWLPVRARRLGEVTGAMHAALARVTGPGLAPVAPGAGAVAGLVATLEREIATLSGSPVAGRLDSLRAAATRLAGAAAAPALAIRTHGDYHLGQVLWSDAGDWVVIDMEGEPARTLAERRRPAFALRDVAGMTRSFAYAADGAGILAGVEPPSGWEGECRAAFLAGWRATVDPRLVPPTEEGLAAALDLCELQKVVYELRYELAHRPDWVRIPVAGLERILEAR